MQKTSIFDSIVITTLESLRQPSAAASLKLTALIVTFVVAAIVSLAVTGFEAHIVFATFETIFGEDDTIWKPWIMALASLILVLAVHFLAHKNAKHPVIKFIDRLAGLLIPVYLIGIGVLIVASLYHGGVGDMLFPEDIVFQAEQLDPQSKDPMAKWMVDVVSPLAGVLFSIGIGSLTVISVFVANHALTKAEQSFRKAVQVYSAVKQDNKNIAEYQQAQQQYEALQKELDTLKMRDDFALCNEIADEVLLTIQHGLEPTINLLNREKFIQRPEGLVPPNQINIAALEKAIKPIQSITRDDILKHTQ